MCGGRRGKTKSAPDPTGAFAAEALPDSKASAR
jgi:hypothetical protein